MPKRIAELPMSERGYPVPYFVAWLDGVPEFRVADPIKMKAAINESRCYVCGQKLGRYKCFAVGPMCTVNHISAEPPSHSECCKWSVKACPFLLNPGMVRREKNLPNDVQETAGVSIRRNPGVTALWVVTQFKLQRVHNGVLFAFPDPVSVSWWKAGRPATRAEVLDSVNTGLPFLEEVCASDLERAELALAVQRAYRFFPNQ